jgi:hypothetical protein
MAERKESKTETLRVHWLTSAQRVEDLIRYLYHSVSLRSATTHIGDEERTFYNRQSPWQKDITQNPDKTICKADDPSDCIMSDAIMPSRSVKYNLAHAPGVPPQYICFGEFVGNIDKHVTRFGLESVLLESDFYVTIVNKGKEYEAHRGRDHCQLLLPQHESFNLVPPITLKGLADACFRVKSLKFNVRSELFASCSVVMKEKKIVIDMKFVFDERGV